MNKSAMKSGKVRSTGVWVNELIGVLAEMTGNRPSVRSVPLNDNEKLADMVWWHSTGPAECWIGVSQLDAELLLRLRQQDMPGQFPDPVRATLADILERSWGAGEIAAQSPADLANQEVCSVQFAGGENIRFLVIPVGPARPGDANMDMLMEIELPITIRFGSTQMALRDIVGLSAGSIIEFDRRVDEPVEVMVNGHVVALGEAVTVQGAYGIRISEISSRRERLVTSSFPFAHDGRGEQIG